ncbi:MAG TPA: hypothetical protein VFQ72_02920 [Candidatus Paceibacterota bacterium]|nr:hypothetical protein [Candidatus Paceibacterota bacterium]
MVKLIQPATDRKVIDGLADEAQRLAPKLVSDDPHTAAFAAMTAHPEFKTPDGRSVPVYAAVVAELIRRKKASSAPTLDVSDSPKAKRSEGSFSATVARWMEEDEERRYKDYHSLQPQEQPQQITIAEGQLELDF